jgi:hypothetical protein
MTAGGLEPVLIFLFLRHHEISHERSDAGQSKRKDNPVISLQA